ncbi:MAG: c-type cytochrome [Terriglobia bacterium]
MRIYAILLAGLMLAFAAAGCNRASGPSEANAAPPAIGIPVGPVPGPGKNITMPSDPYAGDLVAMTQGRRLFVWFNCAGCHGGHGGGGMGPSLRDQVWLFGGSDAAIFASISEGRGEGMPAWGTKIPADQIWKIVAYIKSMRTPQEPDPPSETPQPVVRIVH